MSDYADGYDTGYAHGYRDGVRTTLDDPPHGRTWCRGGLAQFVSHDPSKAQRWWRCPTCKWVGWSTRSDTPPIIDRHAVTLDELAVANNQPDNRTARR